MKNPCSDHIFSPLGSNFTHIILFRSSQICLFLNLNQKEYHMLKKIQGFYSMVAANFAFLEGCYVGLDCISWIRTSLFGLYLCLLTGQGLLSPSAFLSSLVVGKFQTRHCPLRRRGGPTRKRRTG